MKDDENLDRHRRSGGDECASEKEIVITAERRKCSTIPADGGVASVFLPVRVLTQTLSCGCFSVSSSVSSVLACVCQEKKKKKLKKI